MGIKDSKRRFQLILCLVGTRVLDKHIHPAHTEDDNEYA